MRKPPRPSWASSASPPPSTGSRKTSSYNRHVGQNPGQRSMHCFEPFSHKSQLQLLKS
jgi:hypothetical protein